VGRPLSREDGSVFCICYWPLPAQSSSGPSLLGLATIFYCLRFETSRFVASYDSQGHGGGIRPRLHTGNWHSLGNCQQLTAWVAPVVFQITPRHGRHRKHIFPYCCVFAVTCLSSRCLGIAHIHFCCIPFLAGTCLSLAVA
jgi:hypothetical protein